MQLVLRESNQEDWKTNWDESQDQN